MKEHHVDAGHAPAQMIGRVELTDDVPQHHADRVGRAGDREAEERQPEPRREPEHDRWRRRTRQSPTAARGLDVRFVRPSAPSRRSSARRRPTARHTASRSPSRRRRRTSCAKIGSSAVADEKNVAKKSSSIVERMIGDEKTKPSPSRTARRLMSLASRGSRTGTSRIISSATITHTNVSAFTA